MHQFTYVEDYLEVIQGTRDLVTGKRSLSAMFSMPLISLARYDVEVLMNMTERVLQNNPLTERQGTLACRIILKYKRQLAHKNIDVSPVENPQYRIAPRKMDYSKAVYITDDTICLRFPYTTALIEDLRKFRTASQGKCVFDRDKKEWKIGLTEYNLNWIYIWAKQNEFSISDEISYLFNLIEEAESTPYAIELEVIDDGLSITNCPDSLREYIAERIGDLDINKLPQLIDLSAECGFTINPDIILAAKKCWGTDFINLANSVDIKMEPTKENFMKAVNYAIIANRLPIVFYEPDLSGTFLSYLNEGFPSEKIIKFGSSSKDSSDELNSEARFIHCVKPYRGLDYIPMLISKAGMVFGAAQQSMIQRAGKIVYIANDVYTKDKDRKAVKIES